MHGICRSSYLTVFDHWTKAATRKHPERATFEGTTRCYCGAVWFGSFQTRECGYWCHRRDRGKWSERSRLRPVAGLYVLFSIAPLHVLTLSDALTGSVYLLSVPDAIDAIDSISKETGVMIHLAIPVHQDQQSFITFSCSRALSMQLASKCQRWI